jgi:hypothetical protein
MTRFARLGAGRLRAARLLAALLLAGAAATPAVARDLRANSPQAPPIGTVSRFVDFLNDYHDVGSLWLAVSNLGIFGNLDQSGQLPSAQWPPNSRCEYLYSAGLWVGGLFDHCEPFADYPQFDPDSVIFCEDDSTMIVITDTLVSTGQYSFEFFPDLFSPTEQIYESFEGRPGGNRAEDDDGDGSVDEDPLNGRNDDPLNDARVDEDYGAISQQMFACVYRDTATFFNERIQNPIERHVPVGLEVVQESYQYTAPAFDDFVGLEFRVKNVGHVQRGERVFKTLRQVFLGFFVDSDVGCVGGSEDVARHLDDRAGFVQVDTILQFPGAPDETLSVNVGFMRDEPSGEDGSGATGWFGTMFLGHTIDSTGLIAPDHVGIHAYKSWSNGEEDPDYDGEAYQLLTGGDPGSLSEPIIDVGSQRPDDWRQLISAGPFAELRPDSTLIFQSAFVIGEGREGLIANALSAQRIFNRPVDDVEGKIGTRRIDPVARAQLNHWSGASAPPPPEQRLVPGDHRVTIEWDNFSQLARDVLTGKDDFAGYEVWKAVGWRREAAAPRDEQWFRIADISREELARFDTGLEGIGKYRLVDTEVKNGFPYWYAVTAYDSGDPAFGIPAIFGKFTQAAALVYPKWNPTNSLGDDIVIPNEAAPGMVGTSGPFMTLDNVHVVPNPYKERADWDLEGGPGDPTGRRIYFINLPEKATIRIYSLTGDLLKTIEHRWVGANADPDDPDAGTYWNLVTRNNQEVVSGVYLYQIDSDVGSKVGKFAIIR